MTPNDAQIDLLLRAYSRKAGLSATGDDASGDRGGTHLDADELNAFSEGALPPATSARYVSHLADCDNCRKLATQLSMAATSAVPLRVGTAIEASEQTSLWQRFKGLLAVPNLRYAAFALVVIAAVGITFLAVRRGGEDALVARNTRVASSQDSAMQEPAAGAPNVSSENRQAPSSPSTPSREGETANKASTEESPMAAKEGDVAKNIPVSPGKRADAEVAQPDPAFAPPPPGESAERASRADKDLKAGEIAAQAPPQPKKADDEFRLSDRTRADEITRSREMDSDRARAKQGGLDRSESVNKSNVVKTEPRAATNRVARDQSGQLQELSRTQGLAADSGSAVPEERKAGGRSFRRQGGAWIDKKFKSSMSTTDIRRGSEEFRALDSGLRSIADQLSGEIVVVRKGKAYRIH